MSNDLQNYDFKYWKMRDVPLILKNAFIRESILYIWFYLIIHLVIL